MEKFRIGMIGGGPSALFMLKQLLKSKRRCFTIDIFEKGNELGVGMPYGRAGAGMEHVTNVSDNEIPELVYPVHEWVKTVPSSWLHSFELDAAQFNEYQVLPRLFFGQYLCGQFELLMHHAKELGIPVKVHYHTEVMDVIDHPEAGETELLTAQGESQRFHQLIICTGHTWPKAHEGMVPGYFDSPYPPAKLEGYFNHPIAIRGASLTAVDAVRTLARRHGEFFTNEQGKLSYRVFGGCEQFHMVLHALHGLLPAIRFHLKDPGLSRGSAMSPEEAWQLKEAHGGFIPLDYLFNRYFKEPIREEDPELYARISDMDLEAFVAHVMSVREGFDPIQLFKAEYAEAEISIRRHESVYWKEMLAVLSYGLNYPAKHMSAEDMMRLKKTLMPLISIVIAFMPQSSCDELIALHESGCLSLVAVDKDSRVEPAERGVVYHYGSHSVAFPVYIDCVGQPHLSIKDFPFASLVQDGVLNSAKIAFREADQARDLMQQGHEEVEEGKDGGYYLCVPGVAINDYFQVLNKEGRAHERIYLMAVPFIGGYNPDYSGLDFCETATERIMMALDARLAQSFLA